MGKQWKQWQTLFSWAPKITADGDCSLEIKRYLLLGRKAMINLGNGLKSRGITLPTKVYLVNGIVFPVVMYGCESWTIKKAEHWRIDAFELWCWRKLLRVPWTARRSDQSILKDISPEYSLEGLMLKLKLQSWCEELTHLKRPWCWERLKVGGEGDDRGWDSWMASLTWWTWVWASSGSWWWTGEPGMLQFMGSQKVIHDWATELNWYGFFSGLSSIRVASVYPYGNTTLFWLRQLCRKLSAKCVFQCCSSFSRLFWLSVPLAVPYELKDWFFINRKERYWNFYRDCIEPEDCFIQFISVLMLP